MGSSKASSSLASNKAFKIYYSLGGIEIYGRGKGIGQGADRAPPSLPIFFQKKKRTKTNKQTNKQKTHKHEMLKITLIHLLQV